MILNDARKGIIACIWPAQTRDQSPAAEAFHPTFEFGIRTVRDCGLFENVRADGTLSRATDWALGPRPSIQMHRRTYVQYPRGTHDPPLLARSKSAYIQYGGTEHSANFRPSVIAELRLRTSGPGYPRVGPLASTPPSGPRQADSHAQERHARRVELIQVGVASLEPPQVVPRQTETPRGGGQRGTRDVWPNQPA